MNINRFSKRAAASVATLSLAFSAVAAGSFSANATDVAERTAAVAVDTTYLQGTLGLPADTVIETVTYDRFQWLLRQPGQFAFLIGSTADVGFAANAVKVDTAAKLAGASKVYWFDPNLTGQTGVKTLDTRNGASINLASASQTAFGNIWKNVLGQNLGNGFKSAAASSTSVTITADDSIVNDAVDPLFDYRSSATPAVSSTADLFFTYDKDHVSGADADKILSWVDLSNNGSVSTALGTAFTGAGGGSAIDELGQFEWWKDAANTKHNLAYADDARYGGDILDSTDDDNGWVVKQITYPELLHVLDTADSADKNFVILFGGTWCHNTRAVIKSINKNAVENGVTTVYNFDLVLDGGTTNGTNGGSNPIHVRSGANSGSTFNFRPSYVYGDVVRKYLKNLVTEYDPHAGSHVTYYPGGDLTVFPDVVRKLQVPFLINYQRGTGGSPSSTSIKRQWIQRNVDASTGLANYKEYMSEWWFTNPSAQLGLNFAIPTDETTLSDGDKLLLSQARSNAAFGAQAIADLNVFFDGLPGAVAANHAVDAASVSYGNATTVRLTLSNLYGRTPVGTATLTVAGDDYSAAVAKGLATFTTAVLPAGNHDYSISYATDSQIVGFTHAGSLSVSKAEVSSVVGTITKAPTKSTAGKLKVAVNRNTALATVGGAVTVTLRKGATVKVITGTVANGQSILALPKLAKGSWTVSVAYLGADNFNAKTVAVSAIRVK